MPELMRNSETGSSLVVGHCDARDGILLYYQLTGKVLVNLELIGIFCATKKSLYRGGCGGRNKVLPVLTLASLKCKGKSVCEIITS